MVNRASWQEVASSWATPGAAPFFHLVLPALLDPLLLRWIIKLLTNLQHCLILNLPCRFSMASLFPGKELEGRQRDQLAFTLYSLDKMHCLLDNLGLKVPQTICLSTTFNPWISGGDRAELQRLYKGVGELRLAKSSQTIGGASGAAGAGGCAC